MNGAAVAGNARRQARCAARLMAAAIVAATVAGCAGQPSGDGAFRRVGNWFDAGLGGLTGLVGPSSAVPAAVGTVSADRLIGMKGSEVEHLFGAPDFVRRDRQSRLWRFHGEACVFDMFLYPAAAEGDMAVRHVEARDGAAAPVPSDGCLQAVISRRRGAPAG